jgi:hypothetical protein
MSPLKWGKRRDHSGPGIQVQNLFKYEDNNLVLSINMDLIFAIWNMVLKVYVPRSSMKTDNIWILNYRSTSTIYA